MCSVRVTQHSRVYCRRQSAQGPITSAHSGQWRNEYRIRSEYLAPLFTLGLTGPSSGRDATSVRNVMRR